MELERNGHYSDSESIASDCSSNDEDKIHVGSEYQASVPNNVLDKSFCYLELDKSDPVWLPLKVNVSSSELNQFIKEAYSMNNICEEQALSILHSCSYDLDKAQQCLTQTKRFTDTLDKWSYEEREHFINAYNYHGKKFKLIQASLPNKSISDLVDYYYTWKKTRNSVSLITQYCNVLALQHSNTMQDETPVEKSVVTPLSPPISLEVQESLDQCTPPSTQSSCLDVNIDSIEPSISSQDLALGSESADLNITETCTPPIISELATPPSCSSPMSCDINSTPAVNVLNSCDVSTAANVLNLKDLVPEHLNYLLECLESNEDLEQGSEDRTNAEDEKSKPSSSQSSMFARCSICKNILDTWSFSCSQGIVCYMCKPGTGDSEEVMCKQEMGTGEHSPVGSEEANEDISALNRLNEVCKQTCDQNKTEAEREEGKTSEPVRPAGKQHKLKLVPRGLYFNIVDYIEIATNKAEYVDNMFKSMDRDISNLVKKVRSNNISIDTTLDQIESKLPLDKYRSSNNNNNNNDKATDEKVGVLWSDTEIFLVLQGFLKYGMDFETIAEILETKTNKQVGYFYHVNKSYYDLDVLISEYNSHKKADDTKDSEEEKMEVDICK